MFRPYVFANLFTFIRCLTWKFYCLLTFIELNVVTLDERFRSDKEFWHKKSQINRKRDVNALNAYPEQLLRPFTYVNLNLLCFMFYVACNLVVICCKEISEIRLRCWTATIMWVVTNRKLFLFLFLFLLSFLLSDDEQIEMISVGWQNNILGWVDGENIFTFSAFWKYRYYAHTYTQKLNSHLHMNTFLLTKQLNTKALIHWAMY